MSTCLHVAPRLSSVRAGSQPCTLPRDIRFSRYPPRRRSRRCRAARGYIARPRRPRGRESGPPQCAHNSEGYFCASFSSCLLNFWHLTRHFNLIKKILLYGGYITLSLYMVAILLYSEWIARESFSILTRREPSLSHALPHIFKALLCLYRAKAGRPWTTRFIQAVVLYASARYLVASDALT